MIEGKPCKIMEISCKKNGKHGHTKAHYIGIDIFTQKKYDGLAPSHLLVEVVNVERNEYLLKNLEDQQADCC